MVCVAVVVVVVPLVLLGVCATHAVAVCVRAAVPFPRNGFRSPAREKCSAEKLDRWPNARALHDVVQFDNVAPLQCSYYPSASHSPVKWCGV